MCPSSVFLWFSGCWRILVTRRTSEIYSGCPLQQPASNSSSSRGKECRLSGGLGRVIADPVGGSGDDGSPVSWVVEEREEWGEKGGVGLGTWHSWETRGRVVEVEVVVVVGWWWRGAEGIWFGASRASFLACRIPGDQHHGVSFHPPTHIHPPSSPPRTTASVFSFNKSLSNIVKSSIVRQW